MAELRIRTARHTVRVAAPPKQAYQLIVDTARWPQIFEPTVHVEHLGGSGNTERVRLWQVIDGKVQVGDAVRELNPRRLQVRFRRENALHPAQSMGGVWVVLPKRSGCVVALDHYYRVVDDDPTDARWLESVVAETSAALLSSVREAAERGPALDRLFMSCADSVDIDGDPRDVYGFLASAQDWPQRVPQVDRMRVCFPQTRIVYKHVRPPAVMRAHTGSYTVTKLPNAVRATAAHTVVLSHESTKDLVRRVLRDLNLVALGRAKEFAEARRPARVGATQR